MSCSVCGSNAKCGCGQVVGVVMNRSCGCGQSSCSSCCQNVVPNAVPAPFYECAPACAEGHQQRITIQQFSADIKIQDSWNVPACGESATVTSIQLTGVVVGSNIWNPEYGYFEITAFNPTTNQITITNNCFDGNAAAGTNVPSCTEFTVTVPPCDCGSSSQVCVAIDFTAPDVDDCIDITLTSTDGLTAGDTIQIGSGFYFLQTIKPNDIVTICNKGEGITPGTSVIAKDANGNYQYCISVISTNPCDRDAIKTVDSLLGCSDSQTVPLHNMGAGWVATQLIDDDNSAAYRPLGNDDSTCTMLTAQFQLLDGVTVYTNVAVADSSMYVVGDVLEFEGGGSFRFTIDNIPNATHIDFTVSPTPSGTTTFTSGTVVCLQSCCETLTCGPQLVSRTSIPNGIYSTGALTYTDDYESILLDAALATVTAPSDCPGARYVAIASINIWALSYHTNNSELGYGAVLQHEVEVALEPVDAGERGGRLVWTDYGSGATASGGSFPAVPGVVPVWALAGFSSAGSPWYINFHGNHVECMAVLDAGESKDLTVRYNSLLSDIPPDAVDNMFIQIQGMIYLYRA